MDLIYTSHHNWEWALDESVRLTGRRFQKVGRARDLPSVPKVLDAEWKRRLKLYALFRMEQWHEDEGRLISSTWASSPAFAFLDAKDALQRTLLHCHAESLMPPTKLLDFDTIDPVSVGELPTVPALLKAACGAGGFGLYFVFSREDVIHVIQEHKRKAELEAGFLDRLRRDHGGFVPQWSLQPVIQSVKIDGGKYRCQFRVYAVVVRDEMFVFEEVELRRPSWGENDIDELLNDPSARIPFADESSSHQFQSSSEASIDSFEKDCCEGCTARPYNLGRVKSETMRFLIDEVDEVASYKQCLLDCAIAAMRALEQPIKKNISNSHPTNLHFGGRHCEIGIAGIDLMLEKNSDSPSNSVVDCVGTCKPRIVELNCNPAMPGQGKNMSPRYHEHLIDLVGAIWRLGLTGEAEKFTRVW